MGDSHRNASARSAATVAVLTGPSFAADIARGLPTALTLACADAATGRRLQHALSTPALRLYRTEDVAGAAASALNWWHSRRRNARSWR